MEAVEITKLLNDIRSGDKKAANLLIDAVYTSLQGIARNHFSRERPDHTLQPTALVHEAWMRLNQKRIDYKDRGHFYAIAARQMRRILVEHGRQFRAERRGNGLKLQFDESLHGLPWKDKEIEDVDDLLDHLERIDPAAAKTVEMKFFAGMTDEEVAAELGCGHSTVRRHWSFAKAWLTHQFARSASTKES
jgi:RNA polymerase sigma-70 factor (ECF subfamily)